MSYLTDADKRILPLALRQNGNWYIATQWYLRNWEPLPYQYAYHQINLMNSVWLAGVACVSGDTPILDPIDGTNLNIADRVGKPLHVLSWDDGKFVVTKTNPPFLKGRADLYQVLLSTGQSINTTLAHRFLTPSGYVSLSNLYVGSLIGVLSSQDSTNPYVLPYILLKNRFSNYYNANTTFVDVVDIKYIGTGDFYDLNVPITNNYVANGIINHNSGKTVTSAASCVIDCLSIPYFKCLNTSVTAKQAELPFDKFMSWYEGNSRLEHLVEHIKLRPWPVIYFKNFSEWEFRTAGVDARFIRGNEYDRIVFDECGLDYNGEIVKVLRSRLRGVRPDGATRTARLDTITSPTDAPWLRERFDKGWKTSDTFDPVQYISHRARTRDNTKLTEEQIVAMESEYTDEMVDVEMNAMFPDYGLATFPKRHIIACTSQALNDVLEMAVNPEDGKIKRGYSMEEHPRHGITKFEFAINPGGTYIMAGDPGTDDPPKRNAGCVIVVDISKHPATMVYFDWVSGKGSYMPFLNSYKYAMNKYRPEVKLIDTTSTQKAMQELAFSEVGIETDGFNFSSDKQGALNALSLTLSNHDICFPIVKGIDRQLSNYMRDKDDKIAQDIVMTLAMAAYGMRLRISETNNQTSYSYIPNRRSRAHGRPRRRR